MLRVKSSCPTCYGTGNVGGHASLGLKDRPLCPACDGKGFVITGSKPLQCAGKLPVLILLGLVGAVLGLFVLY